MSISSNSSEVWLIAFAVIVTVVFYVIITIPTINLLYRLRFYKTKSTQGVDVSKRNPLWYKHFGKSLDTPSSFGIVLLFFILFMFVLASLGEGLLFSTIIFFALYFVLGLLDDLSKFFLYLKTNKWGLGIRTQMFTQILLAISFVTLTASSQASFWTVFAFSVAIIFILNSYNITDGLDGLIGSLTISIIPVLMYFEYASYGWTDLHIIYAALLGFFIVFTYFNVKPARVILGDVGSTPLGFFFGSLLLRYPITPLIILYAIFLVEGSSSLLQILALKFLKRKVFKIAPLHIHLLNAGWNDTKIVQRSWLVQIVLIACAILAFEFFHSYSA